MLTCCIRYWESIRIFFFFFLKILLAFAIPFFNLFCLNYCRKHELHHAKLNGEAKSLCWFERLGYLCSVEIEWRPKVKRNFLIISYSLSLFDFYNLFQVYWVDWLLLCWEYWWHPKCWRTSFSCLSCPSMQGHHVSASKNQILWPSSSTAFFHAPWFWVYIMLSFIYLSAKYLLLFQTPFFFFPQFKVFLV